MKLFLLAAVLLQAWLAAAASVCPNAPEAYKALLKSQKSPRAFCATYLYTVNKVSPVRGFKPVAVSKACSCITSLPPASSTATLTKTETVITTVSMSKSLSKPTGKLTSKPVLPGIKSTATPHHSASTTVAKAK